MALHCAARPISPFWLSAGFYHARIVAAARTCLSEHAFSTFQLVVLMWSIFVYDFYRITIIRIWNVIEV